MTVGTEVQAVHAHKLKVTIQEDHRVEVRLPDDFPEGPAEVIVLANRQGTETASAQQRTLSALAELRSLQLTPEEEEVLDGFETFRQEHPVRFNSLTDEE
jgi:hypothetical protein